MSVLNSELEEAAAGTMMPIVTPDQVLAKNTAESVDKEFGALKMFSGMDDSDEEDEFDEGVVEDISAKITNLKYRQKTKRTLSASDKENIKNTLQCISKVEKKLTEKDKGFVPYGKLQRKVKSVSPEEIKKFMPEYTEGDKTAAVYLTNGKEVALVAFIRTNKDEMECGFSCENAKYNKYYKYYTDCFCLKYIKTITYDMKKWEKLAKDVEDNKPLKLEFVERDILHENGLDSVIYEDSKIEERTDYFTDEKFFGEAANIDDDIKDIIKKLNDKGYETLYSCSGHPSARLKSDGKRDGIKDKKLYSTAKIVFAKDYNFPSYPDGWEEKKLDEGNIGIYVKGPTFRIINGLPVDQFYNWKKKYMNHLEKWVDELPDKDDIGKEEKSDEVTESMDELLQDLMIDLA